MNYFEQIQSSFFSFLQNNLQLDPNIIKKSTFLLNCDEEKQSFGDINANIAMIAAQILKKNPRQIAEQIIQEFKHEWIEKIEVAGPGFLNFFLKKEIYAHMAQELYSNKEQFFTQNFPDHEKINIEFVSANPTGPLHIGHGRNAILGDVLAILYNFLHQKTDKEFYVNDAGVQMEKLGISLKARCLQELGQNTQVPEDGYLGDYLIDYAKQCVQDFGNNLELEPNSFFTRYAQEHIMKGQQETLEQYGVIFDTWFSEKSLHDAGKVEQALQKLIQRGHTYEQDEALWFRSTDFGDDKDRVLKKANGQCTYVAADIAYLINKFERGFTKLFMILGHDHHSYKTRLHAIMQALGYNPAQLIIILYQLVHVIKDGQPVRMSKRTGKMITLNDIIQEVGKGAARFFFLNRKADAELIFDIDLAVAQNNENPIFYIQYAHVRTISIMNKAKQANLHIQDNPNFMHNCSQLEELIIKKIYTLKDLLFNIAHNHQIHLLAYYTYELAHLFHKYYNTHRVLEADNKEMQEHRLHMVQLVQQTLQTCLFLMGITPLNKM